MTTSVEELIKQIAETHQRRVDAAKTHYEAFEAATRDVKRLARVLAVLGEDHDEDQDHVIDVGEIKAHLPVQNPFREDHAAELERELWEIMQAGDDWQVKALKTALRTRTGLTYAEYQIKNALGHEPMVFAACGRMYHVAAAYRSRGERS